MNFDSKRKLTANEKLDRISYYPDPDKKLYIENFKTKEPLIAERVENLVDEQKYNIFRLKSINQVLEQMK